MKKITTGIVAHVDAGKTTLSEAMLYEAGNLRKLGRVDNGDAFLDTDNLEKKRGITIFSHEAQVKTDSLKLTLLDTPGHMDFVTQTESVLSVLDYAILVISAADGVTSYTKTLWNLLNRNQVPTFIFVNKMDSPDADKKKILTDIQGNLSDSSFDFSKIDDSLYENLATVNEDLLDEYLNKGELDQDEIRKMISQRQVFPVYFGSALKLNGIKEFIQGFEDWTEEEKYSDEFSARVFKISHDEQGNRLTWVKVLGGRLKAKTELLADEKIDQIRSYDGSKYEVLPEAHAGEIVTLTGLKTTYPGQGIETADKSNIIRPVLTYRLNPENNDIYACLDALKILEDEDSTLKLTWSQELQEIHLQVMGEIQLEILGQILFDRFNLDVTFDQGNILYKETINKPIEAVGHFEPLRHYSEAHFLLEPGEEGSGLIFDSQVSLETLAKNYQHQIMTALKSKTHLGVLIGAPITDMKITLINGKASNVHTVGGDFREATYRGVRQGLMEAKTMGYCKLLEPWYDFTLTIPADQVGRAINDIQRMNGEFEMPDGQTQFVSITGSAPVAEMRDYVNEVRSYTHGEGSLECVVSGYRPCHNSEEIISRGKYDPVSDFDNTPNSVFCAHGAGFTVTWDKVPEFAHLEYQYPLD
ncbi:GTP-binding protein [Lactobacillus agrestimuris]|uniref:GTP-binding protein n=1 Tax=Lactobacillus agrestimuris TaxID=2941328 RepID=UPI0020433D0C|nr:TetM/TetW/TetO/TetS family tetracycline resistance ribosomal protection protein [Lactobacillus agrestimuris]